MCDTIVATPAYTKNGKMLFAKNSDRSPNEPQFLQHIPAKDYDLQKTPTLFQKMIVESAKESGRRVRLVEIRTQSPDHPSLLSMDETQYLKFYVLRVD